MDKYSCWVRKYLLNKYETCKLKAVSVFPSGVLHAIILKEHAQN